MVKTISLATIAETDLARDVSEFRSEYHFKKAAANAEMLKASVSTSTGLVGYNLQAPSKNLYPVNTRLVDTTPRVPATERGNGVTGIGTNWVQVTGLLGQGTSALAYVPQGGRAGLTTLVTGNKSANYCTIGTEVSETYEAIHSALGFEDVMSTTALRGLQRLKLSEEISLVGGNASISLGVPTTPSVSASGTTATLPAATYSIIVVALTAEGIENCKLSGATAVPPTGAVPGVIAVTGADGRTFNLPGGSSNKSAAASQAVTLGQALYANTPTIAGAFAYAWFVGVAGSEVLQGISYINSIAFNAPLVTGTQNASTITADNSKNNTYGQDGYMNFGVNGGYYKSLATGTSGTGTALTASGRGTVNELDDMLVYMWNTHQVSPSVFYVNAQEMRDISAKIAVGSNYSLFQAIIQTNGGQIDTGLSPRLYYNPFTSAENPIGIRICVHPNIPAGTILSVCENLPAQYQSSQVPNTAEVVTRQDYYMIDWADTSREKQQGVYSEEVLACYAPFCLGVITNITQG